MKKLSILSTIFFGLVFFQIKHNSLESKNNNSAKKDVADGRSPQSVSQIAPKIPQKTVKMQKNIREKIAESKDVVVGQLESDDELYKKKLLEALGDERLGEMAFNLLQKLLLSGMGVGPDTDEMKTCELQAYCDLPIEEFYTETIKRLPLSEFAYEKSLFQESFLLSQEASESAKIALLYDEMILREYGDVENTSSEVFGGEVVLGPEGIYQLHSQNRYILVTGNDESGIQAALDAIDVANDHSAKVALAVSLVTNFPDDLDDIFPELERLGVTEEEITSFFVAQ